MIRYYADIPTILVNCQQMTGAELADSGMRLEVPVKFKTNIQTFVSLHYCLVYRMKREIQLLQLLLGLAMRDV